MQGSSLWSQHKVLYAGRYKGNKKQMGEKEIQWLGSHNWMVWSMIPNGGPWTFHSNLVTRHTAEHATNPERYTCQPCCSWIGIRLVARSPTGNITLFHLTTPLSRPVLQRLRLPIKNSHSNEVRQKGFETENSSCLFACIIIRQIKDLIFIRIGFCENTGVNVQGISVMKKGSNHTALLNLNEAINLFLTILFFRNHFVASTFTDSSI